MPMEYYLLLVGVICMLVEMVVPGFGIFGITGIICLTGGSYFVMGGGWTALLVLAGFYLLVALLIAFLCVYLPKESKWNPFVLWFKQKNDAGYTGSKNLSALLGKEGVALTVLRPAGTVLVEGKRFDVISLGDFIPKDTLVKIVKVEGSKVFVDAVR